jgi:hypothetical protein
VVCPYIVGTFEWSKSRDGKVVWGKKGEEEERRIFLPLCLFFHSGSAIMLLCLIEKRA